MSASAETDGNEAGVIAELTEKLRFERLAPFVSAAFQFGLLILVIREFEIESRAFLRLAVLAWCGFVVHHFLPRTFRLPFFGVLSLAGIFMIFGAANGAWLIGTGLVLIGLLHTPVPYFGRIALVAGAAAILWALRAGWVETALPPVIFPILGSMFMFRLIVYAYDLKHRSAPFSFWHAISYFFLLPNVCFPLFPVVDYKTFCRSHMSGDDMIAYQRGVFWMLRGCVHLILYRIVYQNLAVDPGSIDSGMAAVQLVVTTYLIYLKVSGSFHLIVGMLQMFCFHLPATNQNYFLATSFTDLWRRINIYWKDFILKIFFNPTYFPLRKKYGETTAIVGATCVAFFATWILHSYQWFWIRGALPWRWQDAAFWALLGVLVMANMLWESSRGRKRSLKKKQPTLRDGVVRGLQTLGMFTFMCLSWSVWTAESSAELSVTWSNLLSLTGREVLTVLAGMVAFGVIAVLLARSPIDENAAARRKREKSGAPWFWRPSLAMSAAALLLLGVGTRPETLSFAPQLAGAVDRATTNKLNSTDAKRLERGYYEDLADVGRFGDTLASLYARQPKDWRGTEAATRKTGSFPPYELIPSKSPFYKGAVQTTNEWGMRDRPYTKDKPEGTWRLALLGSSHAKGSGVKDGETFENLIEDRLNAGESADFEILNFSVGGYGPLSRLVVLEERAVGFEPDAALYIGIDDLTWVVNELANAAEKNHPIPFEHVVSATREVGLEPGLSRVVAEQRLRPIAEELLAWTYRQFVAKCREHGIRPLAVVLPRPEDIPNEAELIAEQAQLMREAGFEVLEADDAYGKVDDYEELWIAPWDKHPNADGHRRVAERLYRDLAPLVEADVHASAGEERTTR
ncbi:MAG: SGNH/GDSL hydrolase family protein [Myxococcota bacterium]